MWNVRLREPGLGLLEEVKFTSLTMVRTYNAPTTLAVTGRLDNIRRLLQPGYGAVVHNTDGQQFSGRLTAAQRNGDGTAIAMFTSDFAQLWERVCYPAPERRWENQVQAADVVLGTVEDRIISLVRRNAGPDAWHSDITGTDPGEDTVFTYYKVFLPNERGNAVNGRGGELQAFVEDPITRDMYLMQRPSATTLAIVRFSGTGPEVDRMTLPGGGHGDIVYLSSATVKGKRQVYLTFRYGSDQLSVDKSGTWVRLPYKKDVDGKKPMTTAAALAYKTKAPRTSKLPRRNGCQGETYYGDYIFRLYGAAYNNDGVIGNVSMPAFVEVIRHDKIVRTVAAGHLARGDDGLPIDGYLEPEGAQTALVNGQPSLLIGFRTGHLADKLASLRVYSLPLAPAARAAEDRRIDKLRTPTSFSRGQTGTTTARFDILGPLVAKLAESAGLGVDMFQAYDDDGTSYLKLAITDTPDLTDSIRVGPAETGAQVILGADWTYTVAIPTISTGLSAAGGIGADRILRSVTDHNVEDEWNTRIEAFIDQSQMTDLSEIDDGINEAITSGSSGSSISVPLGRTSGIRWGTDIPLGAQIVAILDGQPVIDRIRQITTVVANDASTATETTTAVLGAPDSAYQSPTQKQLAAMLRRVQNLERK